MRDPGIIPFAYLSETINSFAAPTANVQPVSKWYKEWCGCDLIALAARAPTHQRSQLSSPPPPWPALTAAPPSSPSSGTSPQPSTPHHLPLLSAH